ncbi:MAG: hypothetical protein R2741_09555 [Methanolobus sp.]
MTVSKQLRITDQNYYSIHTSSTIILRLRNIRCWKYGFPICTYYQQGIDTTEEKIENAKPSHVLTTNENKNNIYRVF